MGLAANTVLRAVGLATLAIGLVTLLLPNRAAAVSTLAVAPGGKLLVGDWDSKKSLTLRLNSDGSPDTGFGRSGVVKTTGGTFATPQPDGKVLVAGGGKRGLVLRRYRRDGSLDRSFSPAGKPGVVGVTATEVGLSASGGLGGGVVLVKRSGQILVVGGWSCHAATRGCSYTTSVTMLLRFSASGRLRGVDGVEGDAYGVSLAPGGKVLFAGEFSEGERQFAARFRRNGKLDPKFGKRGFKDLGFDDLDANASDIAAQADGRPVIATGFGLLRLSATGRPDPGFGTGNGFAACPNPAPISTIDPLGALDAVEVQADQRLVAAGRGCGLMRFTANGALDPSFGSAGSVSLPEVPGQLSVVVQPDGRIIAAWTDFPHPVLVLRRFLPSGATDPSFGGSGTVVIPVAID